LKTVEEKEEVMNAIQIMMWQINLCTSSGQKWMVFAKIP